MNKLDLIRELSQKLNLSQKEVRMTLDTLMEEIILIMEEGEQYKQTGFGTFKTVLTQERISYNPSLKKRMILPVRRKIRFRPSSKIKEQINE
jgi:DNA-binding protein HU-beta